MRGQQRFEPLEQGGVTNAGLIQERLARGSRLLADNAPLAVQVAFARAIESMSSAAASEQPAPATRQLLASALGAGTPPEASRAQIG